MIRITLDDVAKQANVSTATVSRVITNSPLVNEKTKKKVQKIINELNYIPNSMAQNLTNNSTRIIGVVLNSEDIDPLSNNFFSEILSSISEYLLKNNKYYTLYIHSNVQKEEVWNIKALVGSRRVDGLIFLRAYNDESLLEYLDEIKFPFAIIGTPNKADKYIWVDNDNINTTYEVTKELIENKKKNICFLGGPRNLKVTNFRYLGYKRALTEFKISKEYILESTFSMDKAYEIIKEFLKKNKIIDAIVAIDDIFAIAAINACKSLNMRDVEVTGFNNTYIRKLSNYKFKTVEINVKKLGEVACELLIKKIENKKLKSNYAIIPAYIIKEDR